MTRNPFELHTPLIGASILSADFARLGAEMEEVLGDNADYVHLDVMDGHFVPNISFGPAIIAAARRVSRAFFDAHLMIDEPVRYAEAMVKAGADSLTFHVEVAPDPAATAREIRQRGCGVGIALNPGTAVESVYPALDEVDLVLVMSVNPGFSGQKFMPEVLAKARALKPRLRPNQRLEIDGGISPATIRAAAEAGIDWFVVASAIFDQPDRRSAIAELRRALKS